MEWYRNRGGEQRNGETVEAERRARSPAPAGSRDDSPRLLLPPGIADIEFTVTMGTGPEAMTFVRFIPYSRGYVINAVPSSLSISLLLLHPFCPLFLLTYYLLFFSSTCYEKSFYCFGPYKITRLVVTYAPFSLPC